MNKQEKINSIKAEIDVVLKKYEEEYFRLADISESWDYIESELKKEYEELDKKSWLNALFAELANLVENK